MPTSDSTSIYKIAATQTPAQERTQLRKELKEAKVALKEWAEEITRIEERLLELKGKR